jgi:DNA-binding transcriptional LysR family regulator
MKIEGSVALVTGANRGIAAGHRLAGETSLPLAALAADGFLMFPRDLAPRLHDFMVDPCRRAGFEPLIRSESFHTGWELQILGEAPVVAVVPASVVHSLPEGIAAVPMPIYRNFLRERRDSNPRPPA